ncbi:MAG: hypothetical protein CVU43_20150 [Chloroflexi bacterium HGW-Chloroflexi-5]|nr:MAG: hypothetical protein CVU43_20150 [Chloroflexi bacterium HGW-Chloroflexi-5]
MQSKKQAVDQANQRVQVAPQTPRKLNRPVAEAERNSAGCTIGEAMARNRENGKIMHGEWKSGSYAEASTSKQQINETGFILCLLRMFPWIRS